MTKTNCSVKYFSNEFGQQKKNLAKLIDLVVRIELTREIFIATTLRSSEKFDHKFSHVFIFRTMFLESHGLIAVPGTSSNNFVSFH